YRGRKIARLTDRVGRTIQAARLVATTTPFLKQSVPGPEYLRPETGPRFAPSPVSRRSDLEIRYAIQRRVCGLLPQSLRHRRFIRLRGGPGRSGNFSHRQSLTTRWVHIRLFEPQRLFSPLDAPCEQAPHTASKG